jgi:LysR family transcriptional regulator, transcriptional activator for bauABCD operon
VSGSARYIELKLLRVFRAVIRNGGFAAAQTELNTSLANISLQMKQLEEKLGARLCERGLRGLRITPQGALLAKSAEKLLAEVELFRAEVIGIATAASGELRMGVLGHLVHNADCRVHDAISQLRTAMGEVKTHLTIGLAEELDSLLTQGGLDVAVSWRPNEARTLTFIPLFRDRFSLYCSRHHPLFALSDSSISSEHMAQSNHVTWSPADSQGFLRIPPDMVSTATNPSLEAVACLILSGFYIGYLPCSFAERWVETGELRALNDALNGRETDVGMILPEDTRSARGPRALEAVQQALIAVHPAAAGARRRSG